MKKKIFIPMIIAIVIIVFTAGILLLKNSLNNLSQSAFGFSMNENNPGTCEKITEMYAKNTCYNAVAVNTKDSSLCEKINDGRQKDICFSGVANKLRASSLCEKISDSGIKGLCYNNFK